MFKINTHKMLCAITHICIYMNSYICICMYNNTYVTTYACLHAFMLTKSRDCTCLETQSFPILQFYYTPNL